MYKKYKKNLIDSFKKIITSYGGIEQKNYIWRQNDNDGSGKFPAHGAYFGCINIGEELSGIYSDLSIVVFPSDEMTDKDDRWIIALVLGSAGYKNDHDIASLPGFRRMFLSHLMDKSFIRNDFMGAEKDGFRSFCNNAQIPGTLASGVKQYQEYILAATIVDPNNTTECDNYMKIYLAIYAKIRGWLTNVGYRTAAKNALNGNVSAVVDEEKEIKDLLDNRKYVVLQGAPGTGKTRMAKRITEKRGKMFFTQFHAETSYSDFIYGILPDVNSKQLIYKGNKGVFVQSIEYAQKNTKENVYLIIDEINRANLSNVLGTSFYLFEPNMQSSNVTIEVCPGLGLDKLPENLYVIATMNTADRSLAVVDFALRRRFAWYTMKPHLIQQVDDPKKNDFCKDEFNDIKQIFEWYASDEELDLMPGQAYFVVEKSKKNHIEERLKYEILPLIKEYLLDGMLVRAKDDFVNYFRNRIGEEMFR